MTADEVRAKLKAFICRELMGSDCALADDEPLFTGGLIDSFSIAYIAVFIEETFDVYIPDTDLTVENMDTVEGIVARVVSELRS